MINNNLDLLDLDRVKLKGKKVFYTNYYEDNKPKDEYIEMVIKERIRSYDDITRQTNLSEARKAEKILKEGSIKDSRDIHSLIKLHM